MPDNSMTQLIQAQKQSIKNNHKIWDDIIQGDNDLEREFNQANDKASLLALAGKVDAKINQKIADAEGDETRYYANRPSQEAQYQEALNRKSEWEHLKNSDWRNIKNSINNLPAPGADLQNITDILNKNYDLEQKIQSKLAEINGIESDSITNWIAHYLPLIYDGDTSVFRLIIFLVVSDEKILDVEVEHIGLLEEDIKKLKSLIRPPQNSSRVDAGQNDPGSTTSLSAPEDTDTVDITSSVDPQPSTLNIETTSSDDALPTDSTVVSILGEPKEEDDNVMKREQQRAANQAAAQNDNEGMVNVGILSSVPENLAAGVSHILVGLPDEAPPKEDAAPPSIPTGAAG